MNRFLGGRDQPEEASHEIRAMANDKKAPPIRAAFAALWRSLVKDLFGAYRPERHYMRGPGPKSRAKRGLIGLPT
jgi:hypothetical protein